MGSDTASRTPLGSNDHSSDVIITPRARLCPRPKPQTEALDSSSVLPGDLADQLSRLNLESENILNRTLNLPRDPDHDLQFASRPRSIGILPHPCHTSQRDGASHVSLSAISRRDYDQLVSDRRSYFNNMYEPRKRRPSMDHDVASTAISPYWKGQVDQFS